MNPTQLGIGAVAFGAVALLLALQFRAGRSQGESFRRRAAVTGTTAALAALWMAGWFALAARGVLARWDARPPPMLFVFAATVAVALAVAFSPVGRRLAAGSSVGALVLAQGFRLPLEWVMHGAAEAGVMPVQMSWSGWNFDVVTGALALVVGTLSVLGRAPRWLVVAWTALAFVTLFAIAAIALASMPIFHAFGTEPARLNTWVAEPPYIWLPTVLVAFALAGQLVLVRKLKTA